MGHCTGAGSIRPMEGPTVEREDAPAVPATSAPSSAAPHLAMALPTEPASPHGPTRAGRLRHTVRSWTTVDGAKSQAVRLVRGYAGPPIRRARCRGGAGWVEHLPAGIRERLELNAEVVDPLRIEIGSGDFPSPGYVHVDANRWARHVEHVSSASSLPFADRSAEEVLAVHILEHVHSSALMATLREWRRVLRPGGFAQIHVPDAATVFAAYLDSPPESKWTVMIPIFGMTSHARLGQPGALDLERHHVIYDFALLERVLLDAGFDRVEDLSDEVIDRHIEGWRDLELIPRISLVVRAYTAPPAPGP